MRTLIIKEDKHYKRLKNIEKDIEFIIKYNNKKHMLDVFKIIYNNKESITYKQDCVLFDLYTFKIDTIEKLELYLNNIF